MVSLNIPTGPNLGTIYSDSMSVSASGSPSPLLTASWNPFPSVTNELLHLTDPLDVAPFIGTSTFDVTFDVTSTHTLTNIADGLAVTLARSSAVGGTLNVIYDFSNVMVPLPGSFASVVVGAGFFAVWVAGRWVRKRRKELGAVE